MDADLGVDVQRDKRVPLGRELLTRRDGVTPPTAGTSSRRTSSAPASSRARKVVMCVTSSPTPTGYGPLRRIAAQPSASSGTSGSSSQASDVSPQSGSSASASSLERHP